MVHELVGEVIRFGRNANSDVITSRRLGKRHQIGHRLADARTRLDYTVGTRDQRIAHLNRHRDLLVARLIGGVHTIDQAARGIVCLNLLTTRHLEDRQFVGVHSIVGAICLENVSASGAEREDRTRVLPCQEREDRTIGPGHIGVHVGQARHKALGQVGEGNEQHAPHAAQGIDIGVGAVRHRIAAEQVSHKRQLVRSQARKRDAR